MFIHETNAHKVRLKGITCLFLRKGLEQIQSSVLEIIPKLIISSNVFFGKPQPKLLVWVDPNSACSYPCIIPMKPKQAYFDCEASRKEVEVGLPQVFKTDQNIHMEACGNEAQMHT